jgi:hypothetical protein
MVGFGRLFLCSDGLASHSGCDDQRRAWGAFFAPFENSRYFLPWRPIEVSPIGVSAFFTSRGLAVLQSEFIWIWIPSVMWIAAAWLIQRGR